MGWTGTPRHGGPGAQPRAAEGSAGVFLRELLAHTAAGLVVIEGEREAGEAVYRLADALVARGRAKNFDGKTRGDAWDAPTIPPARCASG